MKLLVTMLVTFLWCTRALGQDDSPINLAETKDIGGHCFFSMAAGYRFAVLLPRRVRGPIWSSDEDNPPLSAADAIKLATRKRKELVKDDESFNWKLVSASLKPLHGGEGFWCWEITFEQKETETDHFGNELRLFVLMDGKVLEESMSDDSFNQSQQLELIPSKAK